MQLYVRLFHLQLFVPLICQLVIPLTFSNLFFKFFESSVSYKACQIWYTLWLVTAGQLRWSSTEIWCLAAEGTDMLLECKLGMYVLSHLAVLLGRLRVILTGQILNK